MRLLITNDDGIGATGLHRLALALARTDHEVVVVAPDRDWSGAGASLGRIEADEHVEVVRVELPDCPEVEAWSVAGPPGLAVLSARLGAFGEPPEVVVSGVNAGLNTGRSILHSGTVGAALTGQNFGFSGLAVSVERRGDVWHWDTAAELAVEVLDRLLDAPPRSVLNLNVPGLPRTDVLGVRWARLAPFGAVRAAIADVAEGRLQFELRADASHAPAPDTDQGTVEAGYAALTTLVGIAEAWPAGAVAGEPEPQLTEQIVPGAVFEPVHRVPDASQSRSLHRPLADEA